MCRSVLAATFSNHRQTCVTEHSRTSTVWLLFVSNLVSQISVFNKSRPLNNSNNILVYGHLIKYLFTVAEWYTVDRTARVTISNENWAFTYQAPCSWLCQKKRSFSVFWETSKSFAPNIGITKMLYALILVNTYNYVCPYQRQFVTF